MHFSISEGVSVVFHAKIWTLPEMSDNMNVQVVLWLCDREIKIIFLNI